MFPKERVLPRTVEQIGDVIVPQIVKDILEVTKVAPQERISELIVEQIVDMLVPHVMEEIADVVKLIQYRRSRIRLLSGQVDPAGTGVGLSRGPGRGCGSECSCPSASIVEDAKITMRMRQFLRSRRKLSRWSTLSP